MQLVLIVTVTTLKLVLFCFVYLIAQLCLTLCYPMDCSTPGFPVLHYLWEFAQIHVHDDGHELMMSSNICCPLFLLPSIFPSIRVFSNESALCIRWAKYWNFSFGISPSSEYSGLISFKIGWFDLLAVQGTLKSLHHHDSKASILRNSASFMVQLSHPYMTTGKNIALNIWTLVSKVKSLLFNMPSRSVIAFLPKSKYLLILWLQSQSTAILEPKKMKSDPVFTFSPSICHKVMRPISMISSFLKGEFSASFFSLLFHLHQEALSLVPLCFLP